jgi:hypothetical protein
MIPDVTDEEWKAEIQRIAKSEPSWSLIPLYEKPWFWLEQNRQESR